jgi:hypothetical protein
LAKELQQKIFTLPTKNYQLQQNLQTNIIKKWLNNNYFAIGWFTTKIDNNYIKKPLTITTKIITGSFIKFLLNI